MAPAGTPDRLQSLGDMLDHAPELLQAISSNFKVSRSHLGHQGLRALRLSCKSASVTALTAVRICRIKLSHTPSETEPVVKVAELLKHA